MRAELYRPDDPDTVAVAIWVGGSGTIEGHDASSEFGRLLRPVPVVVDDASLRPRGAYGDVELQPGSVDWFRAALLQRAPELGLAVRFVAPDVRNGWDPASNYRTFDDQEARLAKG